MNPGDMVYPHKKPALVLTPAVVTKVSITHFVLASRDQYGIKIQLTDKARATITKDPLETLVRAADALPPGVRRHFSDVLQRMQGHVANAREVATWLRRLQAVLEEHRSAVTAGNLTASHRLDIMHGLGRAFGEYRQRVVDPTGVRQALLRVPGIDRDAEFGEVIFDIGPD